MSINLFNKGIFLLCMLFSSCVLSAGFFTSVKTPEYVKIATKVRNEAAKKIAKKYHMHLCATSGALMYNVKELGIAFQLHKVITNEEARFLIVDCVDIFLDEINSNSEINPYLVNFPFTAENIELSIYISDEKNRDVYDPLLSVVACHQGKIKYATDSPHKVGYENVYRETYEEALAILGKN